jgi:aminoglycoside phosphotransferase (APT) family kinase protein
MMSHPADAPPCATTRGVPPDGADAATAAFTRAFPGEAVGAVEPVTAGYGSTSWLVTGADRRVLVKFAVRGARDANVAAAVEIARAAGVRTPALLDVGTDPGTGRRFAVFEYVEGRSAADVVPGLPAAAQRRFFAGLAEQCAALHAAPVGTFADGAAPGARAFPTWEALVVSRVGALEERYAGVGLAVDGAVAAAAAVVADLAARVSPDVGPALTHRDVYLDNVVVDPQGRPVLIDFEHAKPWDPLADLAKLDLLVFPGFAGSGEAFARAYGLGARPHHCERRALALGLEVIWSIPYFARWGEAPMAERMRAELAAWLDTHGG